MAWRMSTFCVVALALTYGIQVNTLRVYRSNHVSNICSMWGNFHFKTFDGDVYRFQGTCEYNLVSDCHGPVQGFSVHVKRAESLGTSQITRVLVTIGDIAIELTKKLVMVNSEIVKLPHYVAGVMLEDSYIYIKLYSQLGLSVTWNRDDAFLLELDTKYFNRTCGLCGDYNGVPVFNEFLSDGRVIGFTEFGNKHRIHSPNYYCEDPYEEFENEGRTFEKCESFKEDCSELLLEDPWSFCRNVLSPEPYIQACMMDMCTSHPGDTDNTAFLCSTLSEYSRQCSHAGGMPPNWRTPTFCAMTCPFNMAYSESGSPCLDTCTHKDTSSLCEEHKMDGCFCPPGTLFDDISERGCIPQELCQCKHNKVYNTGEILHKDNEECVCQQGRWICKRLSLPGVCAIEEGSHFSTFDGKEFTYHGNCNYVLSKACEDSKFIIVGQLIPCVAYHIDICLKSIALLLNNDKNNALIIKVDGTVRHNGDIKLPYTTAEFTVFRPSSFHIMLQTNFGLQMQVQLIPIMQLYITLDQRFQSKTCGLCGNFNMVLSDDLMTPQGVVEGTATSFANSWKAQSNCADQLERLDDPCSYSIDSESYAEHWCSKIKDKEDIFAKCHATVNPESYYKRCKYSSCTCEKSEDCLCAIFSSYVRACTEKGVFLQSWRETICDKYTQSCPGSQIFNYRVQQCQRTCDSLSLERQGCSTDYVPVEGCACPEGLYESENGDCVPMDKCPCYHDGEHIKPGRSINIKNDHCICTNGKLQCHSWRSRIAECPAPKVYFNCSTAEPDKHGLECVPTCAQKNIDCYPTDCVSGCKCPAGQLDDGRGYCVKEHDCPCKHDNQFYASGFQITDDCNKCICKRGEWDCTKNKCPGTCTIYGSGHYNTFDKQRFGFSGFCSYIALQNNCGNKTGTFHVITENVQCGTTGTTCSKAVRIILGKTELVLKNGKITEAATDPSIKFNVRHVGLYLVIESGIGLTVLWDFKTTVRIILQPNHVGEVCGLCGNYNGNGMDDFTTQDSLHVSDVLEFVNSWRLDSGCPGANPDFDPCVQTQNRYTWAKLQCSIIKSDTFKGCHNKVEWAPYYDNCVKDSCSCDTGGDCDCFCTAVAAYAQACNEAGVCVAWRTPEICPVFCDYYNHLNECIWHYSPCETPCYRTCLNTNDTCTTPLPHLEGCYPKCPKEKPIFDEKNQVCVEECPGCFINGTEYMPGEEIPTEIPCNLCYCGDNGLEICFHKPGCCFYNGSEYNDTDVIYNVTDNMGTCYYAICINDTVINSSYPCPITTTKPPEGSTTPKPEPTTTPLFTTESTTSQQTGTTTTPIVSTKTTEGSTTPETTATGSSTITGTTPCTPICEWSDWINVYYPTNGDDLETYENIKNSENVICEHPEGIHCRSAQNPNLSLEEYIQQTGQVVQCNVSFGLMCEKKTQTTRPFKCFDYEIRVLCCSGCLSTTTITSTTSTRSSTTVESKTTPKVESTTTTGTTKPSTSLVVTASTTPISSSTAEGSTTLTYEPTSTPEKTTKPTTTIVYTTESTTSQQMMTTTELKISTDISVVTGKTTKQTLPTTVPQDSLITTTTPEPSTDSKKSQTTITTPNPVPIKTTESSTTSETERPTTEKTTIPTTTPEPTTESTSQKTLTTPHVEPTTTTESSITPETERPTTEKTTKLTTTPEPTTESTSQKTLTTPHVEPTTTTESSTTPETERPTTEKTTKLTTTPEPTTESTSQKTLTPPHVEPTTTESSTTPETERPTTEKTTKPTTTPEPTTESTSQKTLTPHVEPTTTTESNTTPETERPTTEKTTKPTTTLEPTTESTSQKTLTTPHVEPTTTTESSTTSETERPTTEKTTIPTTTPEPTTESTSQKTLTTPHVEPTTTTESSITPETERPTTEKTTKLTTTPEPTTESTSQKTLTTPHVEPTTTTESSTTPETERPTTEKTTKLTTTPEPTTESTSQKTLTPPHVEPTTTESSTTPETERPTTEKTTKPTTTPEPTTESTSQKTLTPHVEPTTTTESNTTPETERPTTEKTTKPTTTLEPTTESTSQKTLTTPHVEPTTTTESSTTHKTERPTTEKTTKLTTTPEPTTESTSQKTLTPPHVEPTTTTESNTTPETERPTTEKTTKPTTTLEPTTESTSQKTLTTPHVEPTATTESSTTPETERSTTEKTTKLTTTPEPTTESTSQKTLTPHVEPTTTTESSTTPETERPTTEKTTKPTTTPEPTTESTSQKTLTTPHFEPTTTTESNTTPETERPTTEKTTKPTTTLEPTTESTSQKTLTTPHVEPTTTTESSTTPETERPTTEKTTKPTTTPEPTTESTSQKTLTTPHVEPNTTESSTTPETEKPTTEKTTKPTPPPEPTTESTSQKTLTPHVEPTTTTESNTTPESERPTTEKTTKLTTTLEPTTESSSQKTLTTPHFKPTTKTESSTPPETERPTTEITTKPTTTPEPTTESTSQKTLTPHVEPTTTTESSTTPETEKPTTEKTTKPTTPPEPTTESTSQKTLTPHVEPTTTTESNTTPETERPTTEKTTKLTTPPEPTTESTSQKTLTPHVEPTTTTESSTTPETERPTTEKPTKPTTTSINTSPYTESTTECFCIINGKRYKPREPIFEDKDIGSSICLTMICSDICVIQNTTRPCPIIPPPEKNCTEWGVTENEIFEICNCTLARCIENNTIEYIPYECPPLQNITCLNRQSPVLVPDKYHCCEYYACDCFCEGWGDPHYITFDGLFYSYQGECTFVLMEEIRPNHHLTIYIDNINCDPRESVSCPRALIVSYNKVKITLKNHNLIGAAQLEALIGNSTLKLPFEEHSLRVMSSGLNLILQIPQLNVVVTFGVTGFSVNLPFKYFGNNTQGHCGTCNNNMADDCMLPGGKLVDDCAVMANYWQAKDIYSPDCKPPPVEPETAAPTKAPCPNNAVCELLKSDLFKDCHPHVSPDNYFAGCQFDSCHMSNPTVVCTSVQTYALTCSQYGICINWRNHTDLCPAECPPDKVYRPCGQADPPTCKDKPEDHFLNVTTEGCFCPDGTQLFCKESGVCVDKCGCLDPSGQGREFGEEFQYGCQDCVCDEATVSTICKPRQCSNSSNQLSCSDQGFIVVNVTDPSDACCTILTCNCESSTCPSVNAECPIGYTPVFKVPEGKCCPEYTCEPKSVCVHKGLEYEPGTSIPVTDCQECYCTMDVDPNTKLYQVRCGMVTCNKKCEPGYGYVESDTEECCGKCVKTTCVLNYNDTVHILENGAEWSPSNKACDKFICTMIDGEYVTTNYKIQCPPFDSRNCQPGTVQLSADRCCQVCENMDNGCKVQTTFDYITQNTCHSKAKVKQTHCQGHCNSYSKYTELVSSSCSCCQASRTINRTVILDCLNGETVNYSYFHVEACSCDQTKCLGNIQSAHTEESRRRRSVRVP